MFYRYKLFQILGYFGLLPMVAPLFFFDDPFAVKFFLTYSLAILCFVSGALWSKSFQLAGSEQNQNKILITSNVSVLVAFLSFLCLDQIVLIVLGSLFGVVLFVEKRFLEAENLTDGYLKMRVIVSTIVIILHILGFVFLRVV